jgi:hypothetical protein
MTVHNQPAPDPVTIDDSNDSGSHASVTISSAGVTGLAPAAINLSSSSVSTLTLNGGSANNVYTITGTPATTSMTLNTDRR